MGETGRGRWGRTPARALSLVAWTFLDVHLAMHGQGGAVREVTFSYTRVPESGKGR